MCRELGATGCAEAANRPATTRRVRAVVIARTSGLSKRQSLGPYVLACGAAARMRRPWLSSRIHECVRLHPRTRNINSNATTLGSLAEQPQEATRPAYGFPN